MHILGIDTSPKGFYSQAMTLLMKVVLSGASCKGAKTERTDTGRLSITCCNACNICLRTGKCIRKDDFDPLYAKILKADGLIIATPFLSNSVSAQQKTIIDRMINASHCQLLNGKYTVNIAMTDTLEHDAIGADYLNTILLNFGSFISGSIGTSMAPDPGAFEMAKKRAFYMGMTLAEDIATQKNYPQQKLIIDGNRTYFKNLVYTRRDEWHYEYRYWAEKDRDLPSEFELKSASQS